MQQPLKPASVPAGFHSYSYRQTPLLECFVELLGFFAVGQLSFSKLTGFRVHKCNLLERGMIVATYNHHVRLLCSSPLVVCASKVYPGLGADIVMESLHSKCRGKGEQTAQTCAIA